MAKEKNVFTCSECGGSSPKWLGKCPSCGAEFLIKKETRRGPKIRCLTEGCSYAIEPADDAEGDAA